MDTRDYISIGSLLITIYRHFFPKDPIKYDLSFVKVVNHEINDEVFKRFPDLKLSYNNQYLKDARLFEFLIKNTGNIDITKEMLREPITVCFSVDEKILESKIDDSINRTRLILESKTNELLITWDLLKPKEQLYISLLLSNVSSHLASNNKKKDFIETISINHRITGINSIGKFASNELETIEKTKSYFLINGYSNLLFTLIFISLIPTVSHWVYQFNNDVVRNFEWSTFVILETIFWALFAFGHLFAAIYSFRKSKKFK